MIILLILALPVASIAGFLFYAIRRRIMRKKNEETPGAYPESEEETCRVYGKFWGIVALVVCALLLGCYLLLRFGAISFM